MLEEGVYLAPPKFEAGSTGLVHSPEHIQKTTAAAEGFTADLLWQWQFLYIVFDLPSHFLTPLEYLLFCSWIDSAMVDFL